MLSSQPGERVGRRAIEGSEEEAAQLPEEEEAEEEAEDVRHREEAEGDGGNLADELPLTHRDLLLGGGGGRRDEALRLGEAAEVHRGESARDHVHRRRLERPLARAQQQQQQRHRVEPLLEVAIVAVDATDELANPEWNGGGASATSEATTCAEIPREIARRIAKGARGVPLEPERR